ncbi:hypothetical protein [Enterococcus sp. AZ007]|uniref:hypothetical protein n=1 Tax=Enterococcus sp. AZ007 TaxID=2774839 RepID=UPI003F23BD7D
MFTEHEFFFVEKVHIFELNNRVTQTIHLRVPNTNDCFSFHVNKRIDLSVFKRWDRVRIKLGLSNKGNLKSPQFFIKDIEHVILKKDVVQNEGKF